MITFIFDCLDKGSYATSFAMPSFRALVLSGHERLREHFWFNKRELFCYNVLMVNTTAYTIELWIHLGGLLSTREARVVLGYCLEQLLHFFRA